MIKQQAAVPDNVYFVFVHNLLDDDTTFFATLNEAIAYADEMEQQGYSVTVEILC